MHASLTFLSLTPTHVTELRTVIVKSNDDLRQEVFAMQLIHQVHRIWSDARLPLKLHP